MSLDFTSGGGGGPIPVGIEVVANRFVATLNDGTTKDFGPFPGVDGAPIDAVVAANRDAIAAILADDASDDEKAEALAALVSGIHTVQDADHARLGAVEDRLSANEAILAAQALAVTNLGLARDAHQASITANSTAIGLVQAAVTALQAATGNNAAAIAALQAAATALQAKVDLQGTKLDNVTAIATALQAAQSASDALAAAQAADIDSLRGSSATNAAAAAANAAAIAALQANRTTDAAAIAANAAAITALQGLRATDSAAITANGLAIGALQSAKVADEANIAANGAAIVALQSRATTVEGNVATNVLAVAALGTRATNLETRATADESAIASNTARLTALEAGAPAVFGQARIVVPGSDDAVVVAAYTVLRRAAGRAYTFSLVGLSVANALSISADGKLSTVAAGFDTVADGANVTVTVRATDDAASPATFDLPVVVERLSRGTPTLLTLGQVRITSAMTWNKSDADAAFPGWTECEIIAVPGGASGSSSFQASGSSAGIGGHSGAPRRKVVTRDAMPASAAVTIGAGGASTTGAGSYQSNAGGATALGSVIRAQGAPGYTLGFAQNNMESTWVNMIRQAADPAVGSPGGQGYTANGGPGQPAMPSSGPGAGGGGASGLNSTSQQYAGGLGGSSGSDSDATLLAGGNGGTAGGTVAQAGRSAPSDASGVGMYGSGGGGGSSYQAGGSPTQAGLSGGAGGFPGGGGGGAGRAQSSSGSNFVGLSGPGAAGCLDIIYRKRVNQ